MLVPRVALRGPGQMPPVGTRMGDAEALRVLVAWIEGMGMEWSAKRQGVVLALAVLAGCGGEDAPAGEGGAGMAATGGWDAAQACAMLDAAKLSALTGVAFETARLTPMSPMTETSAAVSMCEYSGSGGATASLLTREAPFDDATPEAIEMARTANGLMEPAKDVPGLGKAALWREAFHLVHEGVASVSDIDTAIAHGPGLRWALMGPFMNLHLSGGEGGIAHLLAHLGGPIEDWWQDLGAPQMTPALQSRVADGVTQALGGRTSAELVAARDALLVDLLRAKQDARVLD